MQHHSRIVGATISETVDMSVMNLQNQILDVSAETHFETHTVW